MDFFENAHVKKDYLRRDSKSEEAVKKQLKQMLFGYKQSDTKLINNCRDVELNKFNDDSSSVSGYSDLNLTISSIELDTTHGTIGSNSELNIIPAVGTAQDTNSLVYSKSSSVESISDHNEDIQTLSDQLSQEMAIESCSDVSINLSASSSNNSTENSSDCSDFDADGELAKKILEKINKTKKRKSENYIEMSKIDVKSEVNNTKPLKEKRKPKKPNFTIETVQDVSEVTETDIDSDSSVFISVNAADMPSKSFTDLLGEYKYSTIKNLPPDTRNSHSTNSSGMFSIEEMNVEDIKIQEEINSLSPEIDDDEESLTLSFEEDLLNEVKIDSTSCDELDIDYSRGPFSKNTSFNDNTIQSEETSDKVMCSDSVKNKFVSPVDVYYGNSCCIFLLKHPAELFFHGKVQAGALAGTIEICGYTLGSDNYPLYAPNYNHALCFKTINEKQDSLYGLFHKLTSAGLSVKEAEDIVLKLEEHDGIISLTKLSSDQMDFVENNMSPTDLFSKPSKYVEDCFKRASEILGCSLYLKRPWKNFEELPEWKNTVRCALDTPNSRGIICGGKGVGKSTFLRYCVNKLLSQGPVLVVDLDPGQAEFTVAGNISATVVDMPLLGPSFTHLKTQIMFNLGMINTMDNPRRYAAAVNSLINYCNNTNHLKSMPWIINTMGMCNNMGLKFMVLTILLAKPTYVTQIDTKNSKKRFETFLDPVAIKRLYREGFNKDSLFRNVYCPANINYTFFVVNKSENSMKNFSLPPRDERYLNFLAYFGSLVGKQAHLLGVTPYGVKMNDLHFGLNVRINEESLTKVINGKIIALCQVPTEDKGSKVFTLKDKPLLCHGHALVRGIDFEKEELYIITPISIEKLSLVNTLVYADWVPELRGQERHLPDGIPVPYRTASTYQKRSLMFAPRRRFNPVQLLKMSRNS